MIFSLLERFVVWIHWFTRMRRCGAADRFLVLEARATLVENCYVEKVARWQVSNTTRNGAHIFERATKPYLEIHGNSVNFNNFRTPRSPTFNGELYNMPFNMNTFTVCLWKTLLPDGRGRAKIEDRGKCRDKPTLEEHIHPLPGVTFTKKR